MNRAYLKYFLLIIISIVVFSSCSSTQSYGKKGLYDPVEVAQVSSKLGIPLKNTDIDDDKNMRLYAECSLWIGVRYRYGGNTKKGVDCSGLVHNIFKTVYRKKVSRTTSELYTKSHTIRLNQLQAGDLLFFATTKNKKKATHVGIYLKNGYFIHASTSSGVIVTHLNKDYYKKRWLKGGRI